MPEYWTDFASEDAARAYAAIWGLVANAGAPHLGPGPKDVHIAVAPPCPFCVTTIPPTDSYFAVTLSPDGKHVAATTLGIVHARAYNENARELFSRRHTISPVLRRLAQGVPAQSFDSVRRSEGHLKES